MIAGLPIAVMGLSGAILALRPQIQQITEPRPAPGYVCDATMGLAAAEAQLQRVVFVNCADRVLRQRFEEGRVVRDSLYDGCTGAYLDVVEAGWLEWMAALQHNLLAGKTIRRLTGLIGVALLLNCLAGRGWAARRQQWRHLYHISLHPGIRSA